MLNKTEKKLIKNKLNKTYQTIREIHDNILFMLNRIVSWAILTNYN